jgi:asparagine N-glycosylation enzyme membrane subunit Stt3
VKGAVAVYAFYHCCATAYEIRMQSIEEFGPVIHEFDPYFNFRATEVRNVRNGIHSRLYSEINSINGCTDDG